MSDHARRWSLFVTAIAVPSALVASWAGAAEERLRQSEGAAREVAIASVSNDSYCTPELKGILRRVAASCGLVQGGGGRGCQPMQAQKVAALSGVDFNALFKPLSQRAHLIQFDATATALDAPARALVETAWSD